MILAVQYAAAMLIQSLSGFRYIPAFRNYALAAVGLAICACGALLLRKTFELIRRGDTAPLKALMAMAPRLTDIMVVFLFAAAQLTVLAWLKAAMPYSVGFRADHLLANADAILFGRDPWQLLTWIPGGWIDRLYLTWIICTLGLLAVIAMLPPSPLRDRSVKSYFLIVASCALGQYALPSAGPIFYARLGLGDRFTDLPAQPWVAAAADYLWSAYQAQGSLVGIGISAFPSLHVAGATWIALTLAATDRRLAVVGLVYASAIAVGSVLLGWHYALDGIAGIAIALIAWRLCGLAYPKSRRIEQQAAPLNDAGCESSVA